jgi:hypothetical protein
MDIHLLQPVLSTIIYSDSVDVCGFCQIGSNEPK